MTQIEKLEIKAVASLEDEYPKVSTVIPSLKDFVDKINEIIEHINKETKLGFEEVEQPIE